MSVSYAPVHLQVPEGFQNLLEGFTREVLRQQPDDIISFGAQYFRYRLDVRESEEAGKAPPYQTQVIGAATSAESSATQLTEQELQSSDNTRRTEQAADTDTAGASTSELSDNQEPHADTDNAETSTSQLSDNQEPHNDTDAADGSTAQLSDNQVPSPAHSEQATIQAEDVDLDLTDPMLSDAAVKIQASFRGMQTRKKLRKENDENADNHTVAPSSPDTVPQDTSEQPSGDSEEVQTAGGSDAPSLPAQNQEEDGESAAEDDEEDDIIDDDGGDSLDENEPANGEEEGEGEGEGEDGD